MGCLLHGVSQLRLLEAQQSPLPCVEVVLIWTSTGSCARAMTWSSLLVCWMLVQGNHAETLCREFSLRLPKASELTRDDARRMARAYASARCMQAAKVRPSPQYRHHD